MISLLFFFSVVLTFFLTPLVISLAKKFHFMDLPEKPHPAKIYKKSIPRAGGLAVFLGIFLVLGVFTFFYPEILNKKLVGILLASSLIVGIGLADDRFDLNPYLRLFTNFLAVLFVVGAGIGIQGFTNPLGGTISLETLRYSFFIPGDTFFSGPHSILILADIFAFFWIIWIMNTLNWSSGVDGQLAGISVIGFAALGFVSLRSVAEDPNQLLTAALSFTAAGAYLGFLPWSFYPQKIMPGYGGSTLAGFLLATLSILSGAKLATAALVLAVPLVDGAWTIARRLYHKQSPVWGDRKHLHHQLLKRGWTVPRVVVFYYSLTALLAIIALSLDSQGKLFAIAMVGIILLGVIFTINILGEKGRSEHS